MHCEPLEARRLRSAVPRYDHIVVLVEENKSASAIYGNADAPYLNSLANAGAKFSSSYGVAHPSEPNYLALFSGSTQGVTSDGTYQFSGENIASQLKSASLSFKGYAESPSVGRHDPWESFDNAAAASTSFAKFPTNFKKLPTVSFVSPNLADDMHDGTIAAGDMWARQRMSGYAKWAKTHNSLLIVTWDESDNDTSNKVATVFYGAHVKRGSYGEKINHFNVLRTIEDSLGLSRLAHAKGAAAIADVFG